MTSFSLKIIAVLSMLVDHIGAVFPLVTPIAFRWIGRIAFPLFAYMIAEGCRHTKNIYKYLLRLGIFALISEVFFDIAFNRRTTLDGVHHWNINFLNSTNIFYTLFLGVACVAIYEGLKTKKRAWLALLPLLITPAAFIAEFVPALQGYEYTILAILMLIYTASALCFSRFLLDRDDDKPITIKDKIVPLLAALPLFLVADEALESEFGWFGVGLIFLLYLANPSNKVTRTIAVAAGMVSLYGLNLVDTYRDFVDGQFVVVEQTFNFGNLWTLLFALIAVPLIYFYNGKYGIQSMKTKWAFYVFYPAHIAILSVIWFIFVGA